MRGEVAGHGVTQDGRRAEGVVGALHVPKGAGGDEGSAAQCANRFIAEGTEGSGSEGGAAPNGIIPVIRMRGQPGNALVASQSTPEANEPRDESDGAIRAVGFGEQGNKDDEELPRKGSSPLPGMEKTR